MYEFTPFKKTEKLLFESFIQLPKELLNREDYKFLSPNAMLLYSILTDRLSLSFKQLECNKKIQFHDAKGNMYVIFKREEIQEKLHIGRSALDSAVLQLKECNLIKETKQGKNMPNIIYLGKTIGMIENEKREEIFAQETSKNPYKHDLSGFNPDEIELDEKETASIKASIDANKFASEQQRTKMYNAIIKDLKIQKYIKEKFHIVN